MSPPELVRQQALDLLQHAWDVAGDHRGISASVNVDLLTDCCRELGLDVARIEAAPYPQYGCPKLKVIAELLGAPVPTDDTALESMMEGNVCSSYCEDC